MRKKKNLALRPYLEAIEGHCRPLAKEELLRIVLALAGEVTEGEREGFLARIAGLLPGALKRAEKKGDVEAFLDRIEDLGQEIKERMAAIEDGTFWDEGGDGDGDGYYDDEPDSLSDEQKEELAECFGVAGGLFMSGRLAAAKTIYARLFDLLREITDQPVGWLGIDVDLREARARYCRTVYELAEEKARVEEVVAAMEVEAEGRLFDQVPDDYPQLRDLLDAQTGDPSDFTAFLPAWEKALAAKGFSRGRLAALRLEAAFMRGGVAAVATLAREWREQQPMGYLAWLDRLAEAAEWPALRDAAQEALSTLSAGEVKASAAGFLVMAGQQLTDDKTLLTGKRERFRALPKASSLLSLLAEAGRQGGRERELDVAIHLLTERQTGGEFAGQSLPVKALLMAGRLDEALARVTKVKEVGWSYDSSVAVVFAAILHLVSGGHADFPLIQGLMREYAGLGGIPFDDPEADEASDALMYREISLGLGLVDHKPADLTRCHDWARKAGEERVNLIISNKKRHAYDRAALILGALAEARVATGDKAAADHLLHDYYQLRYNRYSAFRKEVKAVVGSSPALRLLRL